MRLNESAILTAYQEGSDKGNFDFYRCDNCRRVITREEELLAFSNGETLVDENRAQICPCGSKKYKPERPRRLRWNWLRPNVIRYTLKLVLARGLAPWCDRHFQWPLPWIERLVRYKEA